MSTDLHLLKVPTDSEVRYEAIMKMIRTLTTREPTVQDKNDCCRQLGLPPITQ